MLKKSTKCVLIYLGRNGSKRGEVVDPALKEVKWLTQL